MKDSRLEIRISTETKDKLRALSESEDKSMADLVSRLIRDEYAAAMTIVGDCARCQDAINATEPEIYWDGERICEGCFEIAKAIS